MADEAIETSDPNRVQNDYQQSVPDDYEVYYQGSTLNYFYDRVDNFNSY